MMNKNDLLERIEHEVEVYKTKIRDLNNRNFTVTAHRGNDVIEIGEFNRMHDMNFIKHRFYISYKETITIAPGETVERDTSTQLNINFDYTFRMLDNNEEFAMSVLITKKNYVLKTDVLEIGDFIRFKRIYSKDKYYSGTAVVIAVETYKLEILVFNNERYNYVDVWAHEIYSDGQDFEFEIIAKHEYVERYNDCIADSSLDILDQTDDIEAEDVLDEEE